MIWGKKLYAKVHPVQHSLILACCEKELIRKTLEDEHLFFEIKANFYKGELVDEARLAELLAEADSINLLGEKPVRVALGKGFIKETDVIKVKGIPHVNIFKL